MKKTVLLVCYLILILSLGGCRLVRIEEEKRTPLEYEVVEPEQLPDEAAALVEEKKASEFRVTYQSGEELYLIRGYGKQMSGGYSIQVKDLSVSSKADRPLCRGTERGAVLSVYSSKNTVPEGTGAVSVMTGGKEKWN